jgi:hypothetical protein
MWINECERREKETNGRSRGEKRAMESEAFKD